MGVAVDLIGQTFGRLFVVSLSPEPSSNRKWVCVCSCGNVVTVYGANLRRNHTQSCGCIAKDRRKTSNSLPDMRDSAEYRSWAGMIQRCTNSNNPAYLNYGGRGITVCDKWLSFENFYRDMGDRPSEKHSLDRIDNNKGYCKENCRWATKKEQSNNRRNLVVLELAGDRHTITEWSVLLGLPWSTIKNRLLLGWSVEKALTKPVRRRGNV